MRRNRKVKKNAVLKSGTMGIASLIVSALIMAMIYYVLDSRCTLIARDIGKVERRFAQLEAECVREAARWDELKTPARLTEKLSRFGLEMRYPRQDQIVRMTADGRPAAGQISVARAQARAKAADVALNGASAMPRPSAKRAAAPAAVAKRTARR